MARLQTDSAISGDRVTSALVGAMGRLVVGLAGDAFVRRAGDAALVVSGIPFPTMNGVVTLRTNVTARDVGELLEDPALAPFTHCVQIRPGCSGDVAEMAARHGLHEDESIPLMAVTSSTHELQDAVARPGLTIRTIAPTEASLHASLAAAGFELPVEMFDTFATPAVLGLDGFATYVGFVEGIPVTTALGIRVDDYVGIFDVATPPAHRGRGYGAAVTAKATLDGLAAGASFAFLQSSEMGYRVYDSLGFRELETWSVWVSGPPSHS